MAVVREDRLWRALSDLVRSLALLSTWLVRYWGEGGHLVRSHSAERCANVASRA